MTRKLPDIRVLKHHVDAGMSGVEIATMYGCHPDTLRYVLRKAGLLIAIRSTSEAALRPASRHAQLQRQVEIQPDRVVFTREVTAGMHGGTMFQRISVPRITSHIAALQEAGRC
ncbi:MAG: hypothetical protein E6Q76_10200 [Rhizobium sp.]|nr:MAG: hypothetical protein E6Q76_10200 [Rhizobium sp.]